MNYTIETFKTFDEWRLAHLHAIGGTSAGAIMGVNKYKTKIDVYKQVVGLNDNEVISNEAIEYGIKNEPIIREEFKIDFPNYEVFDPNDYVMYRSKKYPFLIATCDGIVKDKKSNQLGIIEIKTHTCRNDFNVDKWSKELSKSYYYQGLHYLLVRDDCEFIKFIVKLRILKHNEVKETRTIYFYIDRYQVISDLDNLLKEEVNFYKNYVEKRILPKEEIIL